MQTHLQQSLKKLDGSQKKLIRKAIQKVAQNPLPETEGGYGKILGNKNQTKLSGFLKVKLRGAGLRIVYKLVRQGNNMLIVVNRRSISHIPEGSNPSSGVYAVRPGGEEAVLKTAGRKTCRFESCGRRFAEMPQLVQVLVGSQAVG